MGKRQGLTIHHNATPRAATYRFGDSVAFYFPAGIEDISKAGANGKRAPGHTGYMSAAMARKLAKRLLLIARDIETNRYTDSPILSETTVCPELRKFGKVDAEGKTAWEQSQ